MIRTISIDIETFSDQSLGDVGVYKYTDSPFFQILLFAYSVDGEPVQVVDLKNGERLPEELYTALTDEGVVKYAFNAQFERVCINRHFGIESVNWSCTMLKAWYCGLQGGLETVGKALGLDDKDNKDKDGKRLINKFCIPSANHQVSLLDGEDWQAFKDYNRRDVEVELKIKEKLEVIDVPDFERDLYRLDQKINDFGIGIDLDMVDNCISIDQDLTATATKRFKELTGFDNPNSLVDIRRFIEKRTGNNEPSLAKGIMPFLMEKYQGYPDVLEVLRIRQLLSKTSTAKYYTMQNVTMADGRSRGNFQHYGAKTGRWAGRLIQVQNLPRNYIQPLDLARTLAKEEDYFLMDLMFDDVPDVLSQLIRTAIVPSEGKVFLVSDFSAIEARVVAWFANEKWVLDVFRDSGKIYEATASQMFNVPMEEITPELRARGKVATLALGYQGGVGALKAMGAGNFMEEFELQGLVDLWRKSNPNIVRFWSETEKAVIATINGRNGVTWADGKLKAYVKNGILFIELPSGRCLAYARPKLNRHPKWEGKKQIGFMELLGSKWVVRDTYGGRLVENIVQATARDVLAFALLNLDKAGFDICMHIHDEVIVEVDSDKGYLLEDVNRILGEDLDWAVGLPLSAEGFVCDYYQKD